MKNDSIRASQLKNIKGNYLIYSILISFGILLISFFVLIILFFLRNVGIYTFNFNHLLKDVAFYLFIIFQIIIIVIFNLVFISIINKKYKTKYIQYLFDECKLNEIYYFPKKEIINKEYFLNVETLLGIKKIKVNESYTCSSSDILFDIFGINYKYQDKKKGMGILIAVDYYSLFNGYLKIQSKRSDFHGKMPSDATMFSLSMKSLLQNYIVASNLKNVSALLENNYISKYLLELELYFNKEVIVLLQNEQLFIFIENAKLDLSIPIYKYVNGDKIDEKVEALISLNNVVFNLIDIIKKNIIENNLGKNEL